MDIGATTKTLFLSLGLALAAAACGGDEVTVDCSTGTIPKFSEVTAWPSCNGCHSKALTGAARNGAPDAINYDDLASAKANAQAAVTEVNAGAMPPGGTALPAAQKDSLFRWALCGTPE